MRYAIVLALLLATGTALAGDTYRFSRGVVTVGDSTGTVMQKAGEPSRVVQLQNGFGAGVGERWEYFIDGKTVMLTIRGGKVISIEEVR